MRDNSRFNRSARAVCAVMGFGMLSVTSVSLAHSPPHSQQSGAHSHHDHSHHEHSHHEHGAHVHGELAISIAMVERELMLTWRVPAGDMVGFEHAPNDAEQRQQIQRHLDWVEGAEWLDFTGIETCSLTNAQATSGQLASHSPGHNDIEAILEWQCQQPLQPSQLHIDIAEQYPAITKIRYEWLTERQAGSGSVASSLGIITIR